MDIGQVAKLERHLSLLRQEYVKLQNKHVDLEQKYSIAVAASGKTGEHDNTFVSRLLKTVAELFDKDLYRCGIAKTASVMHANLPFCIFQVSWIIY